MKWFDSTRMSYGFITMDNKVVFFHVKNVHSGEDHTLKPAGDEVSFILDEYDKGVIDVQFLPTLSDFQSTSDISICEVESHPGDESWETVDSNSESEERTPSGPPSEVPDEVNDIKRQDINTDIFPFSRNLILCKKKLIVGVHYWQKLNLNLNLNTHHDID